MTDIVIGSGPAGVSAAWALLKQGRRVTMLDVGETVEQANLQQKCHLASTPPDQWTDDDRRSYTQKKHGKKVHGILPYGSDFIFRDGFNTTSTNTAQGGIGLKPSFARGGLSNGWGAAILPYRNEDLTDWPQACTQLDTHYQALQEFVPMEGAPSALNALFPMFPTLKGAPLSLSAQGRKLLQKLERKQESLLQQGCFFGPASHAVSAPDCQSCTMCLYGCPYDAIYNASQTVDTLKANPNFTYNSGFHAVRFSESPDGVEISGTNLISGYTEKHTAARVYIACGVIPSAQLVLNSLNAHGQQIDIRDSQYFFLPTLHSWGVGLNPQREPKTTLVQVFMEMLCEELGNKTAHIQFYTYNELYPADMRHRFGTLAPALRPLINALSKRLIVAQAYLHSDYCSSIGLTLKKTGSDDSQVELIAKPNANLPATMTLLRKKLSRIALSAGLLPLTPLSRTGELGSSYHCGSTFPMRDRPEGLESDIWGRPAGLKRIHIVDASVFPSIPATTITLSVMANAHRIATQATALDQG